MTLNDYQQKSIETALPTARSVDYMILGLCNESGEVAGKWKKKMRDGKFSRDEMVAELGDVLWYVAGLATELDVDLESVAQGNLAKLQSRKARDMISGSGDTR